MIFTTTDRPHVSCDMSQMSKMSQMSHVYSQLLSWSCQPGDCVVFHGLTLHGARGNSSTSLQRRVLSTRWLGDDTVLARRPWTVSPPILGGLNYGDRMMSDTFPLVWGEV